MQPKILFSDIDGTLLNDDRIFSNATISEFKRIKNKIPILLISSRMPGAMVHLQKMASIENFPIIAYNGGLIIVDEKLVSTTEIDCNILENIIAYNASAKVHLSLYNNDNWYVPGMDYWAKREINNTKTNPEVLSNNEVLKLWKKENKGAHKIMCMGNVEDIDNLYTYLETNFKKQLHLYRSKSTYIEIAPAEISKKTAVEFILQNNYPQFNLNDAIAFGDNYNDIEMLKSVGYGVAVANAKKEVTECCKYTTLAGNKDGVAHFIQKHITI